MKSKITANAEATAGQLQRLEPEISATFSPVTARRYSQPEWVYYRPERRAMQGLGSNAKLPTSVGNGSLRSNCLAPKDRP